MRTVDIIKEMERQQRRFKRLTDYKAKNHVECNYKGEIVKCYDDSADGSMYFTINYRDIEVGLNNRRVQIKYKRDMYDTIPSLELFFDQLRELTSPSTSITHCDFKYILDPNE